MSLRSSSSRKSWYRSQALSPLRASTSCLAACRAVSCTSHTATTRVSSLCRKPRMSPVPCLPTPMQPSVMRSLGGGAPAAPSADAGMMVGNPITANVPLRKPRLLAL